MPNHNGIGTMSANFGSGQTALQIATNKVITSSPTFWLDTILSTLTPGLRTEGEAESSITDITGNAHTATQALNIRQATYTLLLPNGRASFEFANAGHSYSLATAFGASTNHSFGFVYDPNDILPDLQAIFHSFGASQFVVWTKAAAGIAGNTLCVFDGTTFRILGALSAGVHSYIIVCDTASATVYQYQDSNPVPVATAPYSAGALAAANFYGNTNASSQGIVGKNPGLIYKDSVLTAPQIAAWANYFKLQYGSL